MLTKNAPDEHLGWLKPLPPGATVSAQLKGTVDVVHMFETQRSRLERQLKDGIDRITRDGAIWVSWPKRTAEVDTETSRKTPCASWRCRSGSWT